LEKANVANFDILKKTVSDQKATSYEDVGGFAGYGGKITRFKFF